MFSSSQQRLVTYFENAVSTDTLRQTYIIKGEAGLGKKYVTSKISEYIMCKSGQACGSCNSCLSLKAGANPDASIISNGDKKTIELKKIRDMIKEVYTKPVGGRYKLFVIENAHLMDDAPQNALLKVIEEPPQYAVFILVCDNLNTILPTILSRSHVLGLDAWSVEELKAVYPLPGDSQYMYTYCLGNIGMLKNISGDEEFKILRDGVIKTFADMTLSDEQAVYDAVDFWMKNKENKDSMINVLIMFLRDIMLCKNGMSSAIANTDKLKEIQTVSNKVTLKKSFDMLSLANDAPRLIGKYGNFSMAAQTLLIQLRQMC